MIWRATLKFPFLLVTFLCMQDHHQKEWSRIHIEFILQNVQTFLKLADHFPDKVSAQLHTKLNTL